MLGKFISIEGGDGAGKSTQLAVIAEILQNNNLDMIMTREPGGTPIGENLRELLLTQSGHPFDDDTELMLMFAARSEHIKSVIQPALKTGKWVVSDRFADASFAYQGARGLPLERIENLADWVLQGFMPDITLLFDISVEQGLERIHSRGEADRFEQASIDYKRKVRQIYLQRAKAEPDRIKVIDSSLSIDEVSRQVKDVINTFIQNTHKQA